MTQVVTTLAATSRENIGKGNSRALRRNDQVPAVIYGDKKPPMTVSMEYKMLVNYVNKAGFFTHLFDIDVDGKKHRVLPRDVQFHPVSDRPLHVDFLRVSAGTQIRVHVPVSFIDGDKSPGLKRGGTLNVVHHEIEVLCSPANIPEKFEVSLEGLAINDAVHLSTIKLPAGVKFTTHESDFTIASIAVPSAIRADVEADAATATEAAAASAAAAPAAAGKAAAPAAAGKTAAPAAGGKAAPAAAAAPAKKK